MKIVTTHLLFTATLSATSSLLAQGPGGPPPPVPPVPTPSQNPTTETKRVLGKILFWDEQLSSDNTVACGTCHLPEFGGSDPRPATHPGADGVFGNADDVQGTQGVVASDAQNAYAPSPDFGFDTQVTGRYAPSMFGALWSPSQFWDGRATGTFVDPASGNVVIPAGGSLESQVVGPPLSDVEMAHASRDWNEITTKLAQVDPLKLATNLPSDVAAVLAGGTTSYGDLFSAAFGDSQITATRIAFAIAAYERTLVANQTPFDAFLAGQQNALTPNQRNGLNAFGPRCATCHTPPLFTDNQFHNIGLRPWQEDNGRMAVTGNFNDRGEFKTPSLRNVGLRDRLMHVGWITDVNDALDFYRSGQVNNQHMQFLDGRDPRVGVINFPPPVANAIADFLNNGLTDPRVANGTFPFDRPTLLSERSADQPQQFGLTHPGSGGIIPGVIANSPLAFNNPDFRVGIESGLGGAPALLGLSLAAAPAGTLFGQTPLNIDFGSSLITTIRVDLSGGSAGEGRGTLALSLPASAVLVGVDLFGQWFVLDAGATDMLAASRGVHWVGI